MNGDGRTRHLSSMAKKGRGCEESEVGLNRRVRVRESCHANARAARHANAQATRLADASVLGAFETSPVHFPTGDSYETN